MKQFFLKTFGCQMNDHDSQKMVALLRQEGYVEVNAPNNADLVVINTCSVRERSYQKAVSAIGRLGKSQSKKPTIAVTGCVVSHDGEQILKRFPFVDIVLGPDHVGELPEVVRQVEETHQRQQRIDFADLSDYEFPKAIDGLSSGKQVPVKAYVTIMKGCDNTCSFCIVPFVRGKEVSRSSEEIISEIQALESEGVREVMLLGQNVNSYGKKSGGLSFPELLRKIDESTGIARLRFTSPHPKDLSRELVREYRINTKLCPHMHLPIQSGSNRILKKMRRSYTRSVLLKKVEALRQERPEIALTTDIIVGFPGETEDDFQDTLSLVEEIGFDASYSFSYSPRPNTEAWNFQDDVPTAVKAERLQRLMDFQAGISLKKNRERIGTLEEILVEGESTGGGGQLMGRTPHGRIVNFDGPKDLVGAILNVRILDASPYSMKGELCSSK